MVFLGDDVKRMMLEANEAELNVLRDKYRHILPPRDLHFIDDLIKRAQSPIIQPFQPHSE